MGALSDRLDQLFDKFQVNEVSVVNPKAATDDGRRGSLKTLAHLSKDKAKLETSGHQIVAEGPYYLSRDSQPQVKEDLPERSS